MEANFIISNQFSATKEVNIRAKTSSLRLRSR